MKNFLPILLAGITYVVLQFTHFGHIEYKGRVLSLSDATGSAFSLIPIDNATGNFVKVEQRLTIRIALDDNPPEDLQKLKAGYSVECEVKY